MKKRLVFHSSFIIPRSSFSRAASVRSVSSNAAEEGLLQSAHDCSDGGLAVALAECCFSSLGRGPLGATVTLDGELPAAASLFGETPSRVLVSFEESQRTRLERIAAQAGAPLKVIGRVGGPRLRINVGAAEYISQDVPELEALWRDSLGDRLQAEVIATAAE